MRRSRCPGSRMASLIDNRRVTVDWKVFSFTPKTLSKSSDLRKWCVYVIADRKGKPLYIGKATGRKYRGFVERYVGNSAAICAMAHGSGNRLYVGRIKGRSRRAWYADLEIELIALEHPRYNVKRKLTRSKGVRLKHTGKVPRLDRKHS